MLMSYVHAKMFEEDADRQAALAIALRSLEDGSAEVRRLALRTVAHLARPGQEALAAPRLRDAAWPVRWAAVDCVCWLGQAPEALCGAAELLAERLEDNSWPVRLAAARALQRLVAFGRHCDVELELPTAGSSLPKLLLDRFEVRWAAVELLELLRGVPEASRALRSLVEDPVAPRPLRSRALGLLEPSELQQLLNSEFKEEVKALQENERAFRCDVKLTLLFHIVY